MKQLYNVPYIPFFFTPIKQDEEDCEVVRLKLLVYSLSYSSYFCTSS